VRPRRKWQHSILQPELAQALLQKLQPIIFRAVLVDSSGNVDRTNKTAATVFFKYFFINANSGGLWVQKQNRDIFKVMNVWRFL